MSLADTNPNDAINLAPELHEVLFEDDKVRVLKVTVPAGAHAEMHWHPRNFNYVLAGGKLRIKKDDGTTVEVELREGEVLPGDEVVHEVDNLGDTEVRTIEVEYKT